MSIRRVGKEISFKVNAFSVRYGTLNQRDSEVIYVRARARIGLMPSKGALCDMDGIRKEFLRGVSCEIRNWKGFSGKYIAQLFTNENGLRYGRRTMLKFDIYMRMSSPIDFNGYLCEIKDLSSRICDDLSGILIRNGISLVKGMIK